MSSAELGIPPVLTLKGELDPEDEILAPGKDSVRLWSETFGVEMFEWILEGRNHISPTVVLMSGDMDREKWGEDLVRVDKDGDEEMIVYMDVESVDRYLVRPRTNAVQIRSILDCAL